MEGAEQQSATGPPPSELPGGSTDRPMKRAAQEFIKWYGEADTPEQMLELLNSDMTNMSSKLNDVIEDMIRCKMAIEKLSSFLPPSESMDEFDGIE